MALGFIKKIFSFGKKEVEEVPAEEILTPAEALPTVEQTYENTAAEEALPVTDEPEVVADERVDDRAVITAREAIDEPVLESDLLPDIDPALAEEPRVAEVESAHAYAPPIEPAETTAPEDETTLEASPEISAEAVDLPMDEIEIEAVAIPAPEAPIAEVESALYAPPVEPAETTAPEDETTLEASPEISAEAVDLPMDEIEAVAIPAPEASIEEVAEPAPAPAKQSPSKVTVSRTVEEKQADEPIPVEPEKRLSWFERLRKGLSRSSQQLGDSIGGIFTKRKLDEDTLQDLEDVLIQADLGMETAIRITDSLSATRYGKDISTEEVRSIMASEIEKVLGPVAKPLELDLSHKPHVILVVGVNGTGKTTTIGKLAAKLTAGGLNVMLAAGDTFRAAAIEQLHIWGKRTGAPVVSSKIGADAAGLAFDAWKQAKEAGSDVLIIDTAGRLQNRAELMEELAKIVRVLGKNDPEAPHTVLQTLDATTGQNALNQVEIFKNIAGVNGLVMTKLDGTARGGILVAISAKHRLPVYFIGIGEQVDDLEPFAARDFAKAIAGVA